jgi:hypothetical protein
MMGCPSKPKEPEPDKPVEALVEEAPLIDDDRGKRSSGAMEEEDPSSECYDERIEYAPEPEYVENHSVISWKYDENGAKISSTTKGECGSLWAVLTTIPEEKDEALKASNDSSSMKAFTSSWDALFAEKTEETHPSQDDEEGLDHLFGLFEEPTFAPSLTQPKTQDLTSPDENVSMSMLSQEAQDLASNFCSSIAMDKAKESSLERACANWKENIAFAFMQKDKGDLAAAIENVKNSRRQMLERKRKLLEAWDRQNMALEVFENALSTSLDRIQAPRSDDASEPCQDALNGGFLTAMSQDNVDTEESKPDRTEDALGHESAAPLLLASQCRMQHPEENATMGGGAQAFDQGVTS